VGKGLLDLNKQKRCQRKRESRQTNLGDLERLYKKGIWNPRVGKTQFHSIRIFFKPTSKWKKRQPKKGGKRSRGKVVLVFIKGGPGGRLEIWGRRRKDPRKKNVPGGSNRGRWSGKTGVQQSVQGRGGVEEKRLRVRRELPIKRRR